MRTLALTLALCLSLITPFDAVAQSRKPIRACGDNAGLEGEPALHWNREDFPLTLLVHPEMIPSWGGTIRSGADIWNSRVGFKMFQVEIGPDIPVDVYLDNMTDTVIPVLGLDGDELNELVGKRVLGVTMLDADDDGHLHNAPILFPLNTTAHRPTIDIFTMVHELGHALGLAHDPCKESVMYYADYEGAEEVLRILQEDVTLLRKLYAPLGAKEANEKYDLPRFGNWGYLGGTGSPQVGY